MRQALQILAVAIVIGLLGFLAYRFLFPDETYSLLVRSADRAVLEGVDGSKRSLNAGDVVGQGERVRTGEGGSAMVASGESEIQLKGNTSMLIKKLDESGMDVELEDGRFSAHVRHGSPSVRVSNRGRSVYAVDADFDLAVDGEGALAVSTSRGSVALEGVPGDDDVAAGERLTHLPGQPAVTAAISEALLLEVAWPADAVTREAQVVVEGKTDPYAKVQVGKDGEWSELRADAQGAFSTSVTLQEGANALEVRARDTLGQEERASAEIERRTKAPSGSVGVTYDQR